jgi:ligand-binding sensor domain-containing protein
VSIAIRKIVCDKNGIKWIAAENGLFSFDGVNWKSYKTQPHNITKSISDLIINPVVENEMLFALNTGVTELKVNFTEILFSENISASGSLNPSVNGLLSDTVSAISIDALNVKYFGTSRGLSIKDKDNWYSFLGRKNEEILRDFKISSVATAKNGWTYAATSGGGVSRFKYTDAISGATTIDSIYSGLRSNFINAVVITDDTCQWYGTNKGAAFHTSHYTKIDWTIYSKEDGLISDTVISIAKDLEGNMWFGTNNGVSRLSDGIFTGFTTADGLANNVVNTISADIDGSVWFGTDDGISCLKDNVWINYSLP